jgi:hypothetical protein
MSSLGTNGKALVAATKELLRRWDETRHSWQDQKAREFEQKYIAELQSSVERAGPVFDHLDKLVNKVRTDCE